MAPCLDCCFDLVIDTLAEGGAVAKDKQDLDKDKQRGQQKRLHEVVKEGRRAALKAMVPDDLQRPASHL